MSYYVFQLICFTVNHCFGIKHLLFWTLNLGFKESSLNPQDSRAFRKYLAFFKTSKVTEWKTLQKRRFQLQKQTAKYLVPNENYTCKAKKRVGVGLK